MRSVHTVAFERCCEGREPTREHADMTKPTLDKEHGWCERKKRPQLVIQNQVISRRLLTILERIQVLARTVLVDHRLARTRKEAKMYVFARQIIQSTDNRDETTVVAIVLRRRMGKHIACLTILSGTNGGGTYIGHHLL